MEGFFFQIVFFDGIIYAFNLLVLEELPCHWDICGIAGIVVSLRINKDAVIDTFAEHQHARDGMERICLQIWKMLFDKVVICKRIELEVIELSYLTIKNRADTIRSLTVSAVVDAAVSSTLCLHGFALIKRCFEVEQYIVGSLPNRFRILQCR